MSKQTRLKTKHHLLPPVLIMLSDVHCGEVSSQYEPDMGAYSLGTISKRIAVELLHAQFTQKPPSISLQTVLTVSANVLLYISYSSRAVASAISSHDTLGYIFSLDIECWIQVVVKERLNYHCCYSPYGIMLYLNIVNNKLSIAL